jgi:hypothetical protein
MRIFQVIPFWLLLAVGILPCAGAVALAAGKASEGQLELTIVDAQTGKPIACRIHLKNAAGVSKKVLKMPFWQDHFACPGQVNLKLPKGNYTFVIECGPEYTDRTGHFTMHGFAEDRKTVDMKRVVNMADEGWWAGDLHVHRSAKDIELLMRAEDLHIAPLVTWNDKDNEWSSGQLPKSRIVQFDENRYYDQMAGENKQQGGSLLYLGLERPLALGPAEKRSATNVELLKEVHSQHGWIDVQKPYAWDLPLWLALGCVDSIELAHDEMRREGMDTSEPAGKKPVKPIPGLASARGQWSQEIYYHVLNCGLRIPPSAGSGSGEVGNPLGYNRMYVWVDKAAFTYDAWWEGFRDGRVIVTNGPLIRPLANGRLPGHVFEVRGDETVSIDVAMNLAIRDRLTYLEVIKNGRVAQSERLEDWAKTGHFRPLEFEESGWFLVRVVADVQKTYRFASSAPWYVELPGKPRRISRKSVQFFLDWLDERVKDLSSGDLAAGDMKATAPADPTLQAYAIARTFWQELLTRANAD